MSLNGLESQEINEAYRSALNEGGCWFAFQGKPRTGKRELTAMWQVLPPIYHSGRGRTSRERQRRRDRSSRDRHSAWRRIALVWLYPVP